MLHALSPQSSLPLPTHIKKKRSRQRWFRNIHAFLLLSVEVVVALGLIGLMVLYSSVWREDYPHSWFKKSTLSLVIQDRDGAFLYEKPGENGQFGNWLPGGKIPRYVRITTLAAEDHRIQEHRGVDIRAVVRAAWGNWIQGTRRSGASTLAMQLVRQLRPNSRTYGNKLKEMYWALVLQLHLGWEGILREYLNRAPYGNRVQGIHRAALLYFDRPAEDLSLAQASFLAALPWGPSYLNPFHKRGRTKAWSRAQRILQRAYMLGWITRQEYKEALQDPIRVEIRPSREESTIHFTQRINRVWQKRDINKDPEQQTTIIRTTLDLPLQKQVQKILLDHLKELRPLGAGTGAVIVIDHRNGEILSYLGSHSYFSQKEHGAIDYIQSLQSPGSTLKPFLYAYAVDHLGYTGATLLADMATRYLWKEGTYLPQNDDTQFLGPLRLRVALGNSRNIPALKILAKLGVSRGLRLLRGLGFFSLQHNAQHYGLGLAVGSAEVNLIALARAYAILARDGKPIQLRWLRTTTDSLGRQRRVTHGSSSVFVPPLPEHEGLPSSQATRLVSLMLSDPLARLPSFGRYTSLEYPFPVAVKTGSSQGYRNAWTLAYSDRVVVGCWVGSHDRRSMPRVSGTRGCGKVVHQAMLAAMQRVQPTTPPQIFASPRGWIRQSVCPLSGQPTGSACPGSVDEWFPVGHKHTHHVCPFHQKIRIDRRNSLRASLYCDHKHTLNLPFVVVPPMYDLWAASLRLPRPPSHESPLCPESKPQQELGQLKIRHPLHQARYLLDPTIPKEYSTLGLEAESTQRWSHVVWYHNHRALGQVSWPYTIRWSLQQGTHVFEARSPDGKIHSSPVVIHVQ